MFWYSKCSDIQCSMKLRDIPFFRKNSCEGIKLRGGVIFPSHLIKWTHLETNIKLLGDKFHIIFRKLDFGFWKIFFGIYQTVAKQMRPYWIWLKSVHMMYFVLHSNVPLLWEKYKRPCECENILWTGEKPCGSCSDVTGDTAWYQVITDPRYQARFWDKGHWIWSSNLWMQGLSHREKCENTFENGAPLINHAGSCHLVCTLILQQKNYILGYFRRGCPWEWIISCWSGRHPWK